MRCPRADRSATVVATATRCRRPACPAENRFRERPAAPERRDAEGMLGAAVIAEKPIEWVAQRVPDAARQELGVHDVAGHHFPGLEDAVEQREDRIPHLLPEHQAPRAAGGEGAKRAANSEGD